MTRDADQLQLDPLLDAPDRRLRGDLALAHAMLQAMLAHEPTTVRALLASTHAHRLPRTVIEEAELFSRLSRHSLRAPMETLLHVRRLEELLCGER